MDNQIILKKLEHLDKNDEHSFIDTTYFLPHETKNVNIKLKNSSLSTESLFFDLDKIADNTSSYKHMFPSPDVFYRFCLENNIGYQQNIIFYDHKGIFSSPRAFLTFLAYGFSNISVLDGGFPAFEKFLLQNRFKSPNDSFFKTRQKENCRPLEKPLRIFIDSQELIDNKENPQVKIIDARSEGRFYGTEPEPRNDLLSGHIPSSLNIPYTTLLDNHQCYRSLPEIQQIFNNAGIEKHNTLIFSCGSGITACVVAFAALLIGFKQDQIKIYDASWCEWGNGHFPIEKIS
jgi:thiosulfate/3-mercaptopyruvate sulfurtransferase